MTRKFFRREFWRKRKIFYNLAKNLIMKKYFFLILTALMTVVYGCSLIRGNAGSTIGQGSVISNGSEQLAHIYNPASTSIHPNVFVRKTAGQDIDLYVVINDSELLFSKANSQNKSTARVRIFYKLMESFENVAMLDTAVRIVSFQKSDTPKTYAVKLKLKPVNLEKFVVQTTVTDLMRGKMNISFNVVDKTDSLCADNFSVTKTENSQPLSESFLKIGEGARVDYVSSKTGGVYKMFFPPAKEIPLCPYASDPAMVDTLDFSLADSLGRSLTIGSENEGYFYLTSDTMARNGLVMPCFSEDYPNISRLDKIVEPLAYLTTPAEYDSIVNSDRKKLAIDDFWFSCTNDTRRAKELIKVFYTRAIFANMYFSDYRDGVLTDRGMVYVVLGPPKILAFTSNSEVWTYKDSRSGSKVKFVFMRRQNAMFKEKYVLNRSTEFKPYWDAAVASWRKGTIYTW